MKEHHKLYLLLACNFEGTHDSLLFVITEEFQVIPERILNSYTSSVICSLKKIPILWRVLSISISISVLVGFVFILFKSSKRASSFPCPYYEFTV